MGESELAGIGKFVMRNRQYLGCLRVRDGTLTLEQLHFADEVDPPKGVIVPNRLPGVAKRELELALDLIEGFSGPWDPKKYKDTYTAALRKVVQAKVKGKEVSPAPAPKGEEEPTDLFDALRASVDQAKKGKRASVSRKHGSRRRAR